VHSKTESYGEANKHGNDSWSYPQRGIDFISIDEYGYNYALKDQFLHEYSAYRIQNASSLKPVRVIIIHSRHPGILIHGGQRINLDHATCVMRTYKYFRRMRSFILMNALAHFVHCT